MRRETSRARVTDRGEPVWNVMRQSDGDFVMVGKASGVRYDVPLVIGSQCEQQSEEQEARFCHACHAVEHP